MVTGMLAGLDSDVRFGFWHRRGTWVRAFSLLRFEEASCLLVSEGPHNEPGAFG